jgi:hypothetical protein
MNRAAQTSKMALVALQALTLAIWIEPSVTAKWIYRGCDYPIFGWPLPYRAFSEVSSLEWFVDWPNFALDMAIYAIVALLPVILVRALFKKSLKILNIIFFAMLACEVAMISIGVYAGVNHSTDIARLHQHESLHFDGFWIGRGGDYGTCRAA